jgi:acyl-CoA synthetase (NDP forming)
LRAATLEELVDLAGLLVRQPLPAGRRVAIVTNAGGLGILCADACEVAGLTLAELTEDTRAALAEELPAEASLANPVDLLGSARAETYAAVLPVVLADPGVDAAIVISVPTVALASADVQAWLAGLERRPEPVLGVVMGAEGPSGRVPAFRYPESAARALGRAADRTDWLRRPAGTVPEVEGIDRDAARGLVTARLAGEGEGWLPPRETRDLLSAYGVPLVEERVASSVAEAVAAARELGWPVVVKSAEAGAHKTETGGVALALESEDEVRDAATRIGPPVLVQPMVSGGTELLAGLVQDPVFGALVAFGPGGVYAELIADAGFRIAPLTDLDAAELVEGGKAGQLVAGFRGRPAADAASLRDLLHRLSALGSDLPEVAELDLNPVLGLPEGCLALDARARVARPVDPERTKTW